MKKLIILSVVFFLTLFSACTPEVRYERGVEERHGGREWGAVEVKMTVQKMVASLNSFLQEDWSGPVYIQVKKFRNRTAEHIDSALVTDEITTELIKRRITFLDDSLTEDVISDMERSNSEYYDQSTKIKKGNLKSPNLYLTGDIREAVTTKGNREYQYLVVTLKLYELESGTIQWQEHARFLKNKKKGKKVKF